MVKKHLDIKVSGRVQGVLYRVSAQEEAEKLHISGFAGNEPDGSVLIEAEGEEYNLELFVNWCRQGPRLAKVSDVEVIEGKIQGYTRFRVH